MKMKSFKNQGFTLVEMIVVIAIIAILAAVIIPTTAGFIDRARLSNDRQLAASMTTALQSAIILGEHENEIYEVNPMTGDLTPDAVRKIISDFSEEDISFENASSDTGFYYVPNGTNSRILALKHNDAFTTPLLELSNNQSRKTIGQSVHANMLDPDSLADLLLNNLISTTTTDVVVIVLNLAKNGADSAVINEVASGFDGIRGRIRGTATIVAQLSVLYEENENAPFHENNRLFIGHSFWRMSDSAVEIRRVVFAQGVSHIPNLEGLNGASLEASFNGRLVLPSSVRTIEENAFDGINGLNEVELNSNRTVRIYGSSDEIGKPLVGNHGMIETFGKSDLIDFSDEIDISKEPGSTNYSFERLEIREDVVGYDITIDDGLIEILIFTSQGLQGFASNLQTITFYYNENITHFVYRTVRGEVLLPVPPAKEGYSFKGWCAEIDCETLVFGEGDIEFTGVLRTLGVHGLDNGNEISLYAKWEED